MEPDQTDRMQRLEADLRRLRHTVTALVIVIASFPLIWQLRQKDSIAVKDVLIRDASGAVRTHIGSDTASSFVTIFAPSGDAQLQFIVTSQGPSIEFVGNKGRVEMLMSADVGTPGIKIRAGTQMVPIVPAQR
jgi:hypothetical protein